MPTVPIPFSKGVFQNVDAHQVTSPDRAVVFENFLIDDAGGNAARPGLSSFCSLGDSPTVGMSFFNGYLIAVTQNPLTGVRQVYAINSSGTAVELSGSFNGLPGLVLPGTGRPVFAEDGSRLAIIGGSNPISWAGNIAAPTVILPGSVGSAPAGSHILYLDGYWLINKTSSQEFQFSGPTSALRGEWDPDDFAQAEGLPDNIGSIFALIRELYCVGTKSTEIFQNYGDDSTPFQRTFFIDRGTPAIYSPVTADNTVFFLDENRRFVRMVGRTPTFISSPYDRVIKGFTTVSDCWGARIDIEGFYLIVWTFPTEGRTLVYDYQKNEWSEWAGTRSGDKVRFRMHSYFYADAWNKHFIGDYENGTIWQMSTSFARDGSTPFRAVRRTGEIDHGSKQRKRNVRYLVSVKRGAGEYANDEPILEMRFRDDGGPWSDTTRIPLGKKGDFESVVEVWGAGVYRRRQIEVSAVGAVRAVIDGLEEELEVLDS